jgi:hypothetical protein
MLRGKTIAAALTPTYFVLGINLAIAQDAPKDQSAARCDQLSWSVARERAWFNDDKLTRRVSGARLRKIDRAVELTLVPTKKVTFFLPPGRQPQPDSFSGEVTFFGVPRPGLYQVTLSDEAWIDVFENGVRLRPTAYTSAKDCPGVRESVLFELAPGDLVLVQISNAAKNSIKAALAEAQ